MAQLNSNFGDTSFTVIKSSNILDYAKTLPSGWHFFRGASGAPGNPTTAASAMVIAYVINASQDISLLSYIHGNKAFLNTCSSGTWSSWQELAAKSDLKNILDSDKQYFFVKSLKNKGDGHHSFKVNFDSIDAFGIVMCASSAGSSSLILFCGTAAKVIGFTNFQPTVTIANKTINIDYGSESYVRANVISSHSVTIE